MYRALQCSELRLHIKSLVTFRKKHILREVLRYPILAHSCAHAQAMNEYRGGEISTEVVVDQNLWTKLLTVDGSESVLRAWLHAYGRLLTFLCTDLVRGPY